MNDRTVATNRRVRHDYEIIDTYEAGLVLHGSEVKSMREGKVTIKDAFAHVSNGEAWLIGLYISPHSFSRMGGHEPERTRKLLLHRREIDQIAGKMNEKGLTLVPMRIYFVEGKAKIQLGLGRGKRTYDKRHALKEKQMKREMDRESRRR